MAIVAVDMADAFDELDLVVHALDQEGCGGEVAVGRLPKAKPAGPGYTWQQHVL